MVIIVLIFLKYLKNQIDKKKYYYAFMISLVIFLIIYLLVVYTQISENSDFDINSIEIKKINISYVFLSNFKLIFINLLLGVITFGLFPIGSIIQNTYSLSIIANRLFISDKKSLIIRLIPHGILEIFILVLICIYSIQISIYILKLLKLIIQNKHSKIKNNKEFLIHFIVECIFISVLLAIAAVIEYFVSIYL